MSKKSLLLTSFPFMLAAYANAAPVRAQERNLYCPVVLTQDHSAFLVKASFSARLNGFGPNEFTKDLVPYGADPGDELFCAYSNGRNLLITIPGKPNICYDGNDLRVDGKRRPNVFCTYEATGRPDQDRVTFRLTETLDANTRFYGVRLGMSHKEAAEAITPKVTPVQRGSQEIYVLPDLRQIVLNYDDFPNPGPLMMIEVKPPPAHSASLFDEIRERFGIPNDDGLTSIEDRMVWKGRDGVRIVLPMKRAFGNREFREQYIYVLDGRRIPGLDKQLGLASP